MSRATLAKLFLLAIVVPCLRAQQPPPAARGVQPIRLNAVVIQSNGKPVPGLPQSAFTVLDNGAPQQLQSFRAPGAGTEHTTVLFVVDAVNLDYSRVAYTRQQIDTFLSAHDGHLTLPSGLAIFTDTGTQIAPGYSTDGNALRQAFDQQVIGLRNLRRSTGFWGAEERLQIGLKTLGQLLARASTQPGRKAIVWISPGWPLMSGPGIQLSGKQSDQIFQNIVELNAQMRQAHVTLYMVDPLGAAEDPGRTFYYEEFVKGVRKPSDVMPGDLGLQVLAVQSGGLVLTGSNDISGYLQRVEDDANAAYELTYMPPPAERPNEYHRIEVRVAEPHVTAHALQGYYAQP